MGRQLSQRQDGVAGLPSRSLPDRVRRIANPPRVREINKTWRRLQKEREGAIPHLRTIHPATRHTRGDVGVHCLPRIFFREEQTACNAGCGVPHVRTSPGRALAVIVSPLRTRGARAERPRAPNVTVESRLSYPPFAVMDTRYIRPQSNALIESYLRSIAVSHYYLCTH